LFVLSAFRNKDQVSGKIFSFLIFSIDRSDSDNQLKSLPDYSFRYSFSQNEYEMK
jgi:hypothetical protein